jgi:pyruvate/2-oxoglutarate dehydrogenase complex dihydrolipoamide dehydrogenase (E3) component
MADYDLIVVGAGATGLAAARGARAAGHSVALVEQDRPGGDCTHYGCVPSKTLIETARRVAMLGDGEERGYRGSVEVDFPAVIKHVQSVIAEIEKDESPRLLARQGIDLVMGHATFTGAHTLDVAGTSLTGRRIVLAIGARAAVPPVPGLAELPYLTNETIFSLQEQPEHLLVLGGGPIGCELAQAFRRLGSAVTVVQRPPTLLVRDEPEAGRTLRAALEADGVRLHTGVTVTAASAGPTLALSDGSTVSGSHLLVAAGRQPRTDALDLSVPGVELDRRGMIVVDEHLKTTAGHIFAAGDCASPLQFTHVGFVQGRIAAGNAFAKPGRPGLIGGLRSWDPSGVPWVTFTDPEVAHVGLTEAQAFEQYGDSARVAFAADTTSDRARAAGQTDGFVKMIAAPRKLLRAKPFLRLVGMTAVGPVAGELLAEGALARQTGMLVGRIAQTMHAYPTWGLSLQYAAGQFFGTYAGRTARPARPPT